MTDLQTKGSAHTGFTLIEVCVATSFAILMGAVLIETLLQSERFAASTRLMTNARAIVQRNLNAAAGVVFNDPTSPPPLLATTTGSTGVVCDDDGSSNAGTPIENIQLLRSGTNIAVTGTLRRIVSAEPVPEASTATVRRITFQIDYDFRSRHYTYSETTLRASDNQ